jgi:hypothetical protein
MSSFCLPLLETKKFLEALKDGSLNLKELSNIEDSSTRRKIFAEYVGKENAQSVNALFEERLLRKQWDTAMISFIEKTSGLSKEVKNDMLSRIQKMDKILSPKDEEKFLEDLAAKKLGVESVSKEEMTNIANLTLEMETKKRPVMDILGNLQLEGKTAKEINEIAMDKTSDFYSKRIEYGTTLENLKGYVGELKNRRNIKFKDKFDTFSSGKKAIGEELIKGAGTLKAILSTLDNSFFGRQGIKLLLNLRDPKIWAKSFMSSWGKIGKEWAGEDIMKAIRAEIHSRPNALNGNYDRLGMGAGLNVSTEDAFPENFIEKMGGVSKIYKGFETAYNGSALEMRADLADKFIDIAERQGINSKDKVEMEGIGNLIGGMTGRGNVKQGDTLNALFFSARFLRSNFDTLTSHLFDKKATAFTRKEAAKNLAGIVGSIAAILTIAKISGSKIETDPRGTNFGRIDIGGAKFDITGGQGALFVLASRLAGILYSQVSKEPAYTKNSSGELKQINKRDKNGNRAFGAQTGVDLVEDFIENRFSPALGLGVNLLSGELYGGKPITAKNLLKDKAIPLPVQEGMDLVKYFEDKDKVGLLLSFMLFPLGFSSSIPYQDKTKTTKTKTTTTTNQKLTPEQIKRLNSLVK